METQTQRFVLELGHMEFADVWLMLTTVQLSDKGGTILEPIFKMMEQTYEQHFGHSCRDLASVLSSTDEQIDAFRPKLILTEPQYRGLTAGLLTFTTLTGVRPMLVGQITRSFLEATLS